MAFNPNPIRDEQAAAALRAVRHPAPTRPQVPAPSSGGAPSTAGGAAPPQFSADLTSGLVGPQRDAAAALINLFTQYGLGSLAPKIVQMIQGGMSSDTISIELQQTSEYKQRFAANDKRIKAGLPALSPAEYLATERSYRQIMQAAGLPVGFYDSTDDFTKWLEMDVSPTEVKARVDAASEAINQTPPETLDYLKQWYNVSDLTAFALDPTKAQPLIEQRIKAAEAAALAKNQGVGVDRTTAEQIGRQGFSTQQMQQGFGQVAQDATAATKLSDIYGGDLTTGDLVKEVFMNDAQAAQKRTRLASQERAAFGGSAGAGRGALTSQSTL